MGILARLGIVNETRSEPPIIISDSPVIPSRNAMAVVPDVALTIPTVYRAVQVIYTSARQLTLEVRKNGQLIATPSLINQPNLHESQSSFIKRTVTSLALTGNCYWLKTINDKGAVANLEPLDPQRMGPTVLNGQRVYVYAGDDFRNATTYTADQIAHLKLLDMPGYYRGLGPIQACYVALRGVLDLRAYADNWFADTEHPKSGILTTTENLFPDQVEAYQTSWKEHLANGGVAVLGNGLSFDHAWLDPESAQFLEAQKFSVNEIGRMFGVSSSQLNSGIDGNSLTYATVEGLNLEFKGITLMDYLIEITDALSVCIPRGQEAKFNFSDWLQPDAKTQAEVDAALITAGIKTINEVRAERGLPPLDTPTPPTPPTPPVPGATP